MKKESEDLVSYGGETKIKRNQVKFASHNPNHLDKKV